MSHDISQAMISRKQLEAIAEAVQGVPVWGCLPGSTAAEAGIRYGDIVLKVNGVPTPSIDHYLRARRLRADGFELVIFRDGVEFSVFVAFRPPNQDAMEAVLEQLAEGRYVPTDEANAAPSTRWPS